jgi:hypothetical protein
MVDLIAHLKYYLSLHTQGTNFLHEEQNSYSFVQNRDGNRGISDNSDPRRVVQSSRW